LIGLKPGLRQDGVVPPLDARRLVPASFAADLRALMPANGPR
jgi:hypothetical protein